MESNMASETPAYLLSLKWLKKYYKFLLLDQFNGGANEHNLSWKPETHFKDKFPGPILSDKDLLEEDKKAQNLYGTGAMKGLEVSYIDKYVDHEKSLEIDFIIVH